MKKHTIFLTILGTLVMIPIIGKYIPHLDIIFPLAIAFRVPPDGPPFSESLLPLVGMISILIGTLGFIIYFFLRKHRVEGLKVYCYFMFSYSVIAISIWLIFFGSRFIRYFPISEFGFYVQWFFAVVPHLIWITFLFITIKHLIQLGSENIKIDAKSHNSLSKSNGQ